MEARSCLKGAVADLVFVADGQCIERQAAGNGTAVAGAVVTDVTGDIVAGLIRPLKILLR